MISKNWLNKNHAAISITKTDKSFIMLFLIIEPTIKRITPTINAITVYVIVVSEIMAASKIILTPFNIKDKQIIP